MWRGIGTSIDGGGCGGIGWAGVGFGEGGGASKGVVWGFVGEYFVLIVYIVVLVVCV